MYVKLHRGTAMTHDIEYFPMFEFDTNFLPSSGISYVTNGNYTGMGMDTTANLQNLIPASIPRTPLMYGSAMGNKFVYESNGSGGYYIPELQMENTTLGTKPDDFDSKPQDYYTLETPSFGSSYVMYRPVIAYNTTEPSWDSTKLYYHDITPKSQRITRLYCTENNCSFGYNVNMRQTGSNTQYNTVCFSMFCNPLNGQSGNQMYSNKSAARLNGASIFSSTKNFYFKYNFNTGNLQQYVPHVCFFARVGQYYGLALCLMSDATENAVPTRVYFYGLQENFWGESIQSGNVPGHGNWGDDSAYGGGNGTFSATSNNRGDSTGTTVSTIATTASTAIDNKLAASFLNVYHVPVEDMVELTGVLFSSNYFNKFLQSMYNPISAVLSCHLLPSAFIPLVGLGSRHYTAGGYDLSGDMTIPTTNGTIIGTIQSYHVGKTAIPQFFDAFPDYKPYTKCTLHLPYVGNIDIDINSIVGGEIAVDYTCDVISGNVCAWVCCIDADGNSNFIYQGTGNAGFNIPLFAENQSGAAVGKLVASAAAGALGAFTGNPAALVSSALGAVGSMSGSHVGQVSGNLAGNVGAISDTVCWLQIERPIWANPSTYQAINGIPSEIGGTIAENNCTGFLSIENIELDTLPCTEQEKTELASILKNGIQIITE